MEKIILKNFKKIDKIQETKTPNSGETCERRIQETEHEDIP